MDERIHRHVLRSVMERYVFLPLTYLLTTHLKLIFFFSSLPSPTSRLLRRHKHQQRNPPLPSRRKLALGRLDRELQMDAPVGDVLRRNLLPFKPGHPRAHVRRQADLGHDSQGEN